MSLDYRDFPSLIRSIAATHHKGAIYPMAKRTGLSPALLDKWVKGNVQSPRLTSLARLAVYNISLAKLVELVARPTRRGVRRLASLVAGLLLLGAASAPAAASPTIPSENAPESRDYVRFRRRHYRWWGVGVSPTARYRKGFPRLAVAGAQV